MMLAASLIACDDDEHKGDSPDFNNHVGAVTTLSVNPDKNFFNLTATDFAAEEIEFTVDVDGFGLTEVNSVDVEIVYTEKDAIFNPFKEEFEDSVYAPVLIMNITTFPSTVAITAAQVAAALSRTAADFEVGDGFSLTLPINTADGRRLTVALNSDLCNEPAQPSFGGCGVAWSVACPSNLGGSISYVHTNLVAAGASCASGPLTGSVTWTDQGGGTYVPSDLSFGQFAECYSDEPATGSGRISDVCNVISTPGEDQYGDSYTYTIVNITGSSMTIDWVNTFDDGGTVVLTRDDGEDWPDLSN